MTPPSATMKPVPKDWFPVFVVGIAMIAGGTALVTYLAPVTAYGRAELMLRSAPSIAAIVFVSFVIRGKLRTDAHLAWGTTAGWWLMIRTLVPMLGIFFVLLRWAAARPLGEAAFVAVVPATLYAHLLFAFASELGLRGFMDARLDGSIWKRGLVLGLIEAPLTVAMPLVVTAKGVEQGLELVGYTIGVAAFALVRAPLLSLLREHAKSFVPGVVLAAVLNTCMYYLVRQDPFTLGSVFAPTAFGALVLASTALASRIVLRDTNSREDSGGVSSG